jgi:hypothetical protein
MKRFHSQTRSLFHSSLSVRVSSIPHAGLGLFNGVQLVCAGFSVTEYEGVLCDRVELSCVSNKSYLLSLHSGGAVIDGSEIRRLFDTDLQSLGLDFERQRQLPVPQRVSVMPTLSPLALEPGWGCMANCSTEQFPANVKLVYARGVRSHNYLTRIYLVAIRDIAPYEEILYAYRSSWHRAHMMS